MDERAQIVGSVVGRWFRAVADWCVVAGVVCTVVGAALAYHRGSREDTMGPVLQDAAQEGDVERVARLLDRGEDVNGRDESGRTALTAAARAGNVGVVKLLLSRGADVNKAEAWGGTALMVAAPQGWADVVELLLRSGADARARASSGMDALAAATIGGNVRCVQLILQAGGDPNLAGRKCNLLSYVCEDRVDVVRALLAAGLDPDVPDADGSVPIETLRAQDESACVAEIERAREGRRVAVGRVVASGG